MREEKQITLLRSLAEIEDPRIGPAQLYKLKDILMISLCGVICGANDWANIELYGKAKKEWCKHS